MNHSKLLPGGDINHHLKKPQALARCGSPGSKIDCL
jgi:hypothetical protein